jgi:hypothetical protein
MEKQKCCNCPSLPDSIIPFNLSGEINDKRKCGFQTEDKIVDISPDNGTPDLHSDNFSFKELFNFVIDIAIEPRSQLR